MSVVIEKHILDTYDEFTVEVQIDGEGDASLEIRVRGDTAEERDIVLSFDADTLADINAFWERSIRGDDAE